jgi:3-hydroxybutyryl-CoA dehydrogenase
MIKNIAIIGAGQMGSGIAHVCALGNYHVQVVDISEDQLIKAQKSIEANLDRQVTKATISKDEKEQALSHIQFTTHIQNPRSIDLVIEAVNENMALKMQIFKNLDQSLKDEAILATNTSSIAITLLADSTNHPERVIGMHFMNPAPLMPLVEVIMGEKTSQDTKSKIYKMILTLRKKPVFSKDSPGFIVNRILMPMINEAIYTLDEGVATPEDIDAAMKLGTNQPMGPLELADFIGLDICLAILQVLHEGFGVEKYRPCPLLVNYVTSGRLGRKTGRGFYEYPV